LEAPGSGMSRKSGIRLASEAINSLKQEGLAPFWGEGVEREIRVAVTGGSIRCFHFKPVRCDTRRPIVFVPGFGAVAAGFKDFYSIVHGRCECYYIETREKGSSEIDRKDPQMGMSQSARDIAAAITSFGLDDSDYVLIGACWGADVIGQGMIDGTLSPPTVVLLDPIHRLWFPQAILNIANLIPDWFLRYVVKPIGGAIALGRFEEGVQKERVRLFMDSFVPWKWKRSAYAARDFEFLDSAHRITREVFVVNGSGDPIHDQRYFPGIARRMPRGRFISGPIDESYREYFIGYVSFLFASVSAEEGLPAFLEEYEVDLERRP